MEIYIHIPFCVRKCDYCSFASFTPASREQVQAYLRAVLHEAEIRAQEVTEPVTTVFVGGGTPSLLPPDDFASFLEKLDALLPLRDVAEFTVEANPGTLTDAFLEAAASAGVTRFSLGMQSSDDRILKKLGRIHTFREVEHSVALLKKHNFDNFNLDLMFGIPSQTSDIWRQTLRDAVSLCPKHISAYGLIPEEGTPLFRRLQAGEWTLPPQELEREMYDEALRFLDSRCYRQYEISNFALEGFECVHNIGYWRQVPYLGLGLAAASMRILDHSESGLTCLRRTNPETLEAYERMIRAGNDSEAVLETVSPQEARFETVMLALRMNRGIVEEEFFALHRVSLESCYGPVLAEMEAKGLLQHRHGAWSLTRRGMDIQNSILVEFMDYS